MNTSLPARRCFRIGMLTALTGLSPVTAADDISGLSDEFNSSATLPLWQRVYQTEGWGFDQLEAWDINGAHTGRMTMIPHTSSWYNEWRGVHAYKVVTGDFVVTTDVDPTNRAGDGAPGRAYSLAGIMVRTPRPMTAGPADWTPLGQNYIFLAAGAADQPGTFQFEVKTTVDSASELAIDAGGQRAQIQIARVGSVFLVLRNIDDNGWEVHRRYVRTDMPDTLHVGLTTYTDWDTCAAVGVEYHNTNLLQGDVPLTAGGTTAAVPDLVARFDYVRFQRPELPPALAGRDLSPGGDVSDAELLAFLGDGANRTHVEPLSFQPPTSEDATGLENSGFPLRFQAPVGITGTIEWSPNGADWNRLETFGGTGEVVEVLDATAAGQPRRFYRFGNESTVSEP